jgi:NAD(P)H dehydrogenase (quinone)
MSHIVIVYHSGYGHTAAQAEAVRQGAASVPNTTVDLIKADDAPKSWEVFDKADAIIFGAPTYMGSASASFKAFMDATSHLWFEQKWKDKLAAGFTNSGSQSGDKFNTLVELFTFAMQHGMVWVGLGLLPGNNSSKASANDLNRLGAFGGAMAQSNVDEGPEAAPPEADRQTAAHLGKRVAEIAGRYCQK